MRHEKRLLRAIKARGGSVSTVGSRSLLSRLAVDLGMVCKESDVEATLLVLEAKGQVTIERMAGENSPIRSVVIKADSPKHKPKRKQSQLPEPIQVAVVEDNKEEEVAVGDNTTPEPLHVRLTNALFALQVNADQDGRVKANSLANLLMAELGMSEVYARETLRRLGKLGLRTSENIGGGKFIHHVRMDVTEVTEAMLSESPVKPTAPSVVPADSVEPQADVVPQLLAIIERLESELADAASSLERGVRVVDRLQAENEQLREKLADQATQFAKAAEVIEKYRSKS